MIMSVSKAKQPVIGVIGGGIAGAVAAMHLTDNGYTVELFEAGDGLVNGPPVCHLHAGGNLYREISSEQCITLLKESIDTMKLFPHCANERPTIIAVPLSDNGNPDELLERLHLLRDTYAELVANDESNKVLGEPSDYFALYDRAALEVLKSAQLVSKPSSLDDWMVPFAQHVNLDQLKYPVVLVQEYGLSVFRMAATAELSLMDHPDARVHLNTPVRHISADGEGWCIETDEAQYPVDFILNACGFRSGSVDNMLALKRDRMVEYKAAYVTHWPSAQGMWPEVIFHGERGTPQGMAQLTPYADGFFQLHGMTETITLFEGGLVSSTDTDAQPNLPDALVQKAMRNWPQADITERTERAIAHLGQFVPSFSNAEVAGQPLCGAQQIPGGDPTLRAAGISFEGTNYARTEIVKASSAIAAVEALTEKLTTWYETPMFVFCPEEISAAQVEDKAKAIALSRGYPAALAQTYGVNQLG
uniref:FAD-dependent oxidoreductase n=1 Tax=Thaumasiovibrio occultus TaxID=1891184 RepID=UPI000B34C17D|nr:FAD-dependent oxidoreductase [Thaumasiovibrio occultus]